MVRDTTKDEEADEAEEKDKDARYHLLTVKKAEGGGKFQFKVRTVTFNIADEEKPKPEDVSV